MLQLCKAVAHLHHEREVHILALWRCAPRLLVPTARDDINPLQSNCLSNMSLSERILTRLAPGVATQSISDAGHFRSHHGCRILTRGKNRKEVECVVRGEFVVWRRRRSAGQDRLLVEAPPDPLRRRGRIQQSGRLEQRRAVDHRARQPIPGSNCTLTLFSLPCIARRAGSRQTCPAMEDVQTCHDSTLQH